MCVDLCKLCYYQTDEVNTPHPFHSSEQNVRSTYPSLQHLKHEYIHQAQLIFMVFIDALAACADKIISIRKNFVGFCKEISVELCVSIINVGV